MFDTKIKNNEAISVEASGMPISICSGRNFYGPKYDKVSHNIISFGQSGGACMYFVQCGTINISNTQIEALPTKLTCNELNISNTPIKELDNIYLNSLIASNSLLENFKIIPLNKLLKHSTQNDKMNIFKLDHTPIKELPNNLNYECLDISYTQIKELPENLIVYDELDLTGTKILELPQSLKECKCIKGFIGNKTKYPDFNFSDDNPFDNENV